MELILSFTWTTWLCLIAFVVYTVFYKDIYKWEKVILIILGINLITEIIGAYLAISYTVNGFIYNVSAPITRILTLMLYAHNYNNTSGKVLTNTGIGVVILISIIGALHYPTFQEFHYGAYVISGLVIAALSYLHLRAIALDKAGQSLLIFVFSLANLVYFTLMASSMSAYGLANQISNDFGRTILFLNQLAYGLWSVILITGILWKKKQKT